ncbi:phage tail-collar fiber domain-containing protein [Escherichia coli]|uniref:phage tail-collar fiber domain-containing protein n=1 Tax=Escherichia coli TaxID=562 RepID=UPI000CFABECB|nr:phage tail protein [Escherichia coli]
MSTIITEQYEHWCANQIISGKPARPDTFVFAYIPGQDESAEIPRDEILPDESMIQYRAPVTQYGLLSPNATAFSIILDTTVGDFEYNWIGLLNEESGVLCMIAHTPRQQKIKTANGVQGNNLIRTFSMEFDGAAAAMHIDVSADVWQIDFTARLAGMDEARRLLAFDHYGEAAFLGDGFQISYQNGTVTVAAGIGYVGGLRVSLREPYSLPAAVEDTIWIDASWQGFVTGEWNTVFTFCVRQEHSSYTDGNGFRHFVAPLAKLTSEGTQDLRPKTPDEEQSNALAGHEKSRRHPDATLNEKGFAQYSNDTDSDAEDRAATSKAVKIAMDNANARLAKNRNGSDIPNKPLFIKNVGLQPAVDKAEGAVQRGGDTMTGKLTLLQTSGFGVNTGNALGGNSIAFGDNDTGIKQNGDGLLDIYANGQLIFRFQNGTLQSNRAMNTSGRVTPSDYGNFDVRYKQRTEGVQDVRYGYEMFYTPGGNEISWTFRAPSGHGLSGINVQETGSSSADNIGGVYYRPLQKLINGTWYNVASI